MANSSFQKSTIATPVSVANGGTGSGVAATGLSNLGGIGAATTDTLTNKTIDANGTGNSISNIDVADLANGTDGQLITWDAAGAPATVATGTATQVLTSNGAGAAPTFQDAGGGGAWTLVDYSTASSASDITISSLDLNTDGAYEIVCEITNLSSAQDVVYVTINGLTSGYSYFSRYWTYNGTSAGSGNNYSNSNTQFNLEDGSVSCQNHTIRITITRMDLAGTLRPFLQWHRVGAEGSNANSKVELIGSGHNPSASNLTSIKFDPNTATGDFKVWVRKAATS